MSEPDLEPLLTLREVAALARVSVRTIQRAIKDKRLDAVHYGPRTTRITRGAAARFLYGTTKPAGDGATVESTSQIDRRPA